MLLVVAPSLFCGGRAADAGRLHTEDVMAATARFAAWVLHLNGARTKRCIGGDADASRKLGVIRRDDGRGQNRNALSKRYRRRAEEVGTLNLHDDGLALRSGSRLNACHGRLGERGHGGKPVVLEVVANEIVL